MGLSDEDVREILRLIDESPLAELRIDTPELQLHVRRGPTASEEAGPGTETEPGTDEVAAVAPAEPVPRDTVSQGEAADGGAGAGAGVGVTIESPMLGVFYRAPAPGAEPYVQVGGRVEPETVVCLIEVMKMMNSVEAGVAGTIVEICVQNADLVEHGQTLFRVEPA